jgi:transcription antitermination factor NusG
LISCIPSLSDPEPAWYAVHTRCHAEARVAEALSLRKVEHYLPVFREVHRWKDREKTIYSPVFPGYVFGRFPNAPAARRQVLETRGVVRILGGPGGIERVPDGEIEGVRTLLESQLHCEGHPLISEGAWVKVKSGPLEGLEGSLVRIKNKKRLVVSIDLLGRSISAEFGATAVTVLRAAPKRG